MSDADRDVALGEILADLEAHLKWRLDSGLTRVPAPAPVEAAPAAAEAPAAAAEAPAAAGSGPHGWAQGVGSEALMAVRTDLGDCVRCKLAHGRTNLVFGVGNPDADLVFVGEGPGAEEDRQGEPFVGRAGELLTKMIQAMGRARGDVYICNVVKCRPPGNRDPEPDEVAACEPFLKRQLAAIRPRAIVGLGKFAVQALMGDPGARITRVRGTWFTYEGVPVMPTFHPAYLLRNPAAKRDAWNDLQAVMTRLEEGG